MCGNLFSTPKPPDPPPIPVQPSPREEGLVAQQEEIRRRRGADMSRQATVLTTPLGDPGAGQSVGRAGIGSGTAGGAPMGTTVV